MIVHSNLMPEHLVCTLDFRPGTSSRYGINEPLCVGRLWMVVDGIGRSHFLSFLVHHHHPVAHELDHTEIVADEDVGKAERFPQVYQQVEHLCLNGYIEC